MMNSSPNHFSGFSLPRNGLVAFFGLACLAGWNPAFAETAQEARVTRIINDVKVVGGNAATRPAVLSDQVKSGNGVRTGVDSRAELTFQDLSITRLGANTVFSFNAAGRTIDLQGGAVLVEAPPNAAPINVSTAGFTAAISGGTGLIEFHLKGISKILIPEGQGAVRPAKQPGVVIIVPAGSMITLGPDGKWSKPQKFNVALVMKSSNLMSLEDFGPLPNEALILQVIEEQQRDFGAQPGGEPPHDTTLDATVVRNDAAPPAGGTSSPPPIIGFPVITSPDPYIISSGTAITTADRPTITTNGQTDQGVFYHGAAVDGPVSAALFGSTSAFDLASGFDQEVKGENPAAAFKFLDLQITGNPTADITNGADSLGLVGVNGITSGGPGGNITFANVTGVLLAAENGPVTLGSELSFSGLHDLTIYARGVNGDLDLTSNITTDEHARLYAQRDMMIHSSMISTGQINAVSGRDMTIDLTNSLDGSEITLNAFNNLTWAGETSDRPADHGTGSVIITAGGSLTVVTGDLSFTRHSTGNSEGVNLEVQSVGDAQFNGNLNLGVDNSNGGTIGTGGQISVGGANVSINGSLTLTVSNTNGGSIDNGGGIDFTAVGNATVGQTVNLFVDNSNGGHIGTGGNMGLNVQGDLMVPAISASINNTMGTMDTGVAIDLTVTGAVASTTADAVIFAITNDTGNIGGDASVTAQMGSVAANRLVDFNIFNEGGLIGGNASVDVTVTNGDVTVVGAGTSPSVTFNIDNAQGGPGTGIGANASVTLRVPNGGLTAGNAFVIGIDNTNDSIGGAASVAATVAGAFTVTGRADFEVLNSPGNIAGPVSVTGSLGSVNAGSVVAQIDDSQGNITGSANIALDVAGDVTTTGTLGVIFQLLNDGGNVGGVVGDQLRLTIGGATDTQQIHMFVDNGQNGFIGNGANIGLDATGAVSVVGPFVLEVINFLGGTINNGGNITAHLHDTATVTATNNRTISFFVFNGGAPGLVIPGGTIGTGGNMNVAIDGDISTSPVTTTGVFEAEIANDGGTIGTGGNNNVAAGGNVNAARVIVRTSNSGGSITNGANLSFNAAGTVTTTANAQFEVFNIGGTIGNTPNMNIHAGSWNIGSDFIAAYDNEGGSIGSGGTSDGVVNVTATGNMTVGNDLFVLGSVFSGGTISAARIAITDGNALAIAAGAGGITRFSYVGGNGTMPDVLHILVAPSITSQGGINFNGTNANGTNFAVDGGRLELDPTVLSFGAGGNIQGVVTLNGGDGNLGAGFPAANGGSLTVHTAGDISVSSDIEATTGHEDATLPPTGNGGTVELDSSSGSVIVNNRIEVSSNDAGGTPRRSNAGGLIHIESAKSTGTAIQITSSAQLLSLLNSAATGAGGVIEVKATGPNSQVSVQGTLTADNGTVDIEQTGTNGQIFLNNATIGGSGAATRPDIIKVGALGTNGQLFVTNGTFDANTLIALYGGTSNGMVDFTADCTLSSATTKIIAANVVQINNGVTVTIMGAAADIYTNFANYNTAGFGSFSAGGFTTHLHQNPPAFGQTSGISSINSASNSTARNRSTASRTTPGNAPRTSTIRTTATGADQSPKTAPTSRVGTVR